MLVAYLTRAKPPLLGEHQASTGSLLLKVVPRSGVSSCSGRHIPWEQTDLALRCVKWTTVASACSTEPTSRSSTCSTTAMPAVLSATGCMRKAGSRRPGRTSLREFVGALPPARTILDPPETDSGNFRGVAIYRDGQEVVVVSELEAGYYRYVSEWRLHDDGTISPRFGFSAVENPCVCEVHHHHVYWRFDFDILSEGNNVV